MSIVHETVIPFALDAVFAWHERPGAMQRLLPPWQPVQAREEATSLRDGKAVIGLPGGLRWSAQHRESDFEANRVFVDELVPGTGFNAVLRPLRWRHEHRFEDAGQGRTLVRDVIDTNLPRRMVEPMLRYRHEQLTADLKAHALAAAQGLRPLTVAVTGSNGMVGTALVAFLETGGHRVIRLVRSAPHGDNQRQWDPLNPAANLLDGCDAVIHLAGASISGRFTEKHRRQIRDSRIEPTRKLAEVAARSQVATFVTASAIGIYGADTGEEILDESAPVGTDFLAQVVRDWEAAAHGGDSSTMRRVQVRTGLVQSPSGGILRLMKPLYEVGLGGRLGPGTQWQSWIGLDDLIEIYYRALWDVQLEGPVNAVAPAPVRNSDYSHELARVLRRPDLLPVPAFGPKLLLGEQGAQLLALASQHVVPAKLVGRGHEFRAAQLRQALRHSLGK